MNEINILALLVAGLVPMLIGFIWYNERVFGKQWIRLADMTEEKMQRANMGVIFGFSYVLSVLLALGLFFLTVHQAHILSILVNEPGIHEAGSELHQWHEEFMKKYGNNFRTFKHGAFHGVTGGLLFALPILGVNALFERKKFAYIAINAGFWIVCSALMGGIVCAWQ